MDLNISDKRLKIVFIPSSHVSDFVFSLIEVGILRKRGCKFFSLTRTEEGFTLVIDTEGFKALPHSDHSRVVAGCWVPLNVTAGAYTPAKVTGISSIAKSLIIPLADYLVSVYCLSSYQTDYILVQEDDLSKVSQCLSSQDEVQNHSQGKTMPLDRISLTPVEPSSPSQLRCITHDLHKSSKVFHITTVDQDIFPRVGLCLIDILFYSSGVSEEDKELFFSYTTVEGDITLVMDDATLQRFPHNTIFADEESWRMIKISEDDRPDGLGFVECGIVAQISDPITSANISEYYISTFYSDHTLVPESSLNKVSELLISRQRLTKNRSTAVPL